MYVLLYSRTCNRKNTSTTFNVVLTYHIERVNRLCATERKPVLIRSHETTYVRLYTFVYAMQLIVVDDVIIDTNDDLP
jgi:hypothetical protein